MNEKKLQLTDRDWKEFRVGDILTLKVARSNDKGNLEIGEIPFIGRSNDNNGLQGFYDAPNITQGNCITLGMVGTFRAFWQERDFAASQNILTMRAQWLNRYTALFVCNLIEQAIKGIYSYGKSIKAGTFGDTILSMPSTPEGQPDYDFMEQYIRERVPDYSWVTGCFGEIANQQLDDNKGELKLQDREWEEFKLTDLFDIQAGKRKSYTEPGQTPYITACTVNNGVAEYISDKPDFNGNCITIGKVHCDVFYQPNSFCATNDVNILIPLDSSLDGNILKFITNIISYGEKGKWNYGNQCRVNDCKNIVIKLPIESPGHPDYKFMQDYIMERE